MNESEARYQRPDVARADRPIRLGSFLVTLVEPRKGHEVAFNRWYERDHFYAGCMIGAWQFGGGRYVATRACKAKRYPADSPIVPNAATGSYVAIYWVLDGHHDEWNRWGVDQVNRLHAGARMFAERDHIHTSLYRYADELNAPGSTMPAELALDRAYPGIALLIGEAAPGVAQDRVNAFFRDRPCPADVAVVGTPLPLLGDRPADVPDQESGGRFVQICFSAEDPLKVWDRDYSKIGGEFQASGLGRILFASPFLATIPGTDTYTDQLW
jgi:hypothetical protein